MTTRDMYAPQDQGAAAIFRTSATMRLGVCPARAAADFGRTLRPACLVTLRSPGAEPPAVCEHGLTARLDLVFNDVAAPGPGLVPPSRAMVERLLTFGAAWSGAAPMLVTCYAGISRSPAAAYVIACLRAERGAEADMARALRAASPSATPNPLVVALADAILGREGCMIEAIRGIGRGADAFDGVPFTLDVARRD